MIYSPEVNKNFRQVVLPFALHRLWLVSMSWLAGYFLPSNLYQPGIMVERGWAIVPFRLMDVWFRWDAGWYLQLAKQGYPQLGSDLSAWVFFPLWPMLLSLFKLFSPEVWQNWSIMFFGLLVNNLLALAGLAILRELVLKLGFSAKVAKLAVLLLIFSPYSFYFSALYTESLFFFLAVSSAYLVTHQRWLKAGMVAGLAALTRPPGLLLGLLLLPTSKRQLSTKLLLFWLPLVGMFSAFLVFSLVKTGSALTPFVTQTTWQRELTWPWITFVSPYNWIGYITRMDKILAGCVLIISIWLVKEWWLKTKLRNLAVTNLALVLMPLSTGTLQSVGRYYLVCFPLWIFLASKLVKKPELVTYIVFLFSAIQTFLFIAWCQFYWVA